MRFFRTNIILFPILSAVLAFGCGKAPEQAGNGKIRLTCGLPPVAFVASAIAGKLGEVSALLPEGRSPHDYSPRPADIRNAGKSRFFFTTGMNFENSAVRALPENVEIVDVSKNIVRRRFDDGQECCHDGNDHGHHHHHGEDALDPHVWLSPANAVSIAHSIAAALIAADPENQAVYQNNLQEFTKNVSELDNVVKKQLAPYSNRTVLVYHPAFGYFTDAYKLRQHPLEINGREMTAVQLATVIGKAQKENIKVVFVQPQFNPRTAEELARRIGGTAIPLDPLAWDLIANFKKMSEAVRLGFGEKK